MSDQGFPPSMRGFIQDPNPNPNTTNQNPNPNSNSSSLKRKRNLPGTPDPDAEVIALSPTSLMATNRFVCEICNKGFQRDQNLQLHRRGHNLPWKLKQRSNKESVKKKVYICPEKTCVHHDPARALGDLTGIKKHFSRKHGEKKWKCDKCSKKYAVQSDWKAHSKICGTREYKCDCGTLFSRKDSFITHRAFCDALAEESARFTPILSSSSSAANLTFCRNNELMNNLQSPGNSQFCGVLQSEIDLQKPRLPLWLDNPGSSTHHQLPELVQMASQNQWFSNNASSKEEDENKGDLSEAIISSMYYSNNQGTNNNAAAAAAMSATALLQKAAQMGSTRSSSSSSNSLGAATFGSSFNNMNSISMEAMQDRGKKEGEGGGLTRDFLGVGVGGNQFLQQENDMMRFGAMSSAMDMSHYTRN